VGQTKMNSSNSFAKTEISIIEQYNSLTIILKISLMIKKIKLKIVSIILDNYDILTGRKNSMIPPRRLVNINSGDAEKIGKTFMKYFIELGGLKSTDNVLDVGSGFGRMAVPLTDFLSPNSCYEGLEIIPKGVDWCRKKITSKFKNFKFQLIDIKNDRYNPKGKLKASDLKFPFEDESFDFIILTSVFTHMLPSDLENYMSEISRVLKKGGSCLITYFLLNESSIDLIQKGKSDFKLKYTYENCKIESQEDPEYVIAYNEEEIRDIYKKNNLAFKSVYYGNWSGRQDYLDYQDIVIGKKDKTIASTLQQCILQ
jgi:SAM-dependent methyltransferase